jgi:hypothetical protein
MDIPSKTAFEAMFGIHRLGNILPVLRRSCPAYMMAVCKVVEPILILFQIVCCRNLTGNLVGISHSPGMRDSSATTQKRQLSYPSDALNAFSGLLEPFKHRFERNTSGSSIKHF